MGNGPTGVGGGAAGAETGGYLRERLQAIQACGTVVHMEPEQFLALLVGIETPMVVSAYVRGVFGTSYRHYLTSVRGLAFYTKSREPLKFPGPIDQIEAKSISAPRI